MKAQGDQDCLPNCPNCGQDVIYRYGHTQNGKQRFMCVSCGRQFVDGRRDLYPNRPRCQSCGRPMYLYRREPQRVRLRCSGYPDCRTYTKMNKDSNP